MNLPLLENFNVTNHRNPYILGVLLICSVLLSTCSKEPQAPYVPIDLAAQYRYFPLEIGKFIEYRADSIVYDFAIGGGTQRDSSSNFIREAIVDTSRDQTGLLTYRIERFERRNDSLPWQFKQVLSAARTSTQAIQTDDNLRFLKIVFPLDRFSNWDGNLWIDQYREVEIAGERIRPFVNWNYEVDSLDISAQIGAFAFDTVLFITEVDETNAIERRLSKAKYAKNIGLVWREQWILDSQYCNQIPAPADCLNKPWTEKAEAGYILRQTIINHN